MQVQTVFERYELKYLLNREQKARLLEAMEPYMTPDQYGRSTVCSLYYDTPTFRLIRRSLEKPAYKEKLRLRSYGPAGADTPVFVELKKKYRSVVYKRRLSLPRAQAEAALAGRDPLPVSSQIGREIDYVRAYYRDLAPAMYLSYQREAFCARDGGDFRVTLDENILCRRQALTLGAPVWGSPLLEEGQTLLELKTAGGLPLWMTRLLTELGLYRTNYSKYGTAYRTQVLGRGEEVRRYA